MSQQIQITGGAKVRDLQDVIIGSSGVLSSLGFNVANGVPQLDSNGKILVSQLPNSVMEYKGTWNAATNTPTLANGTGNQGDVYLCNVAGTANFGSGPITFIVGDSVIYSGSVWQRAGGATGSVTSVGLSTNGGAITISNSPITTSGTIAFNFNGTSGQYVNGAGNLVTFPTTIAQAQRLITEVYNETGATLTKGTVVYINGGHGNLPTVTKAIATGDSTSAQTYGVVQNDITDNNNGYVVVLGSLGDLDTQAYPNGTQLYLSSTTAGAWTSTKQYAPAHLVYVGIVVRSHPTQGVVEIRIQNGFELDELHNVSAQTPSNNQGLFYNSSTQLWENKSIATALGYTPANDALVVHLSGDETITGSKTFSGLQSFTNTAGTDLTYGAYLTKNSIPSAFSSSTVNLYSASGNNNLVIRDNGNTSKLQFQATSSYTYTFPALTGTLALTSDIPSITGLVPYTGATGAVNLGFNSLTTNSINLDGNSASGVLNIKSNTTVTTAGASYVSLVSGNVNQLSIWFGAGNMATFTAVSLSTSRTYTLPNASGTLALTSDLTGGTVTSVAALTIGTSGTDLSSSVANSTTTPVITLNVPTASATNRGALSSTDWTTFNNKQNALTNPVTGTGTTNYLPKFTGTSTIGNSAITDDGSSITLGLSQTTFGTTGSKFYVYPAFSTNLNLLQNYNGSAYTTEEHRASDYSFKIGTTTGLILNASGNLGLGVTPSAWSGANDVKAFQLGGDLVIWRYGTAPGSIYLGNNYYWNGTNRVYLNSGFASEYQQSEGKHIWNTAPSGTGNITFTQAMTLTASGRLLLGTTTESTYLLDVNGTGRFSGVITGQTSSAGTITQNFLAYNSGGSISGASYDFQSGGTSQTARISANYEASSPDRMAMRFLVGQGSGLVEILKLYNSTMTVTGAATFSSSVTQTGVYPSFYQNPSAWTGGFILQSGVDITAASTGNYNASIVPTGKGWTWIVGGNGGISVANLSSTGAATFSSSVTAGGLVTINKQNEGLILTAGANTDASYMSTRANNGTGWLIMGSQGSVANYIQTGTGANESAITTVGAYALAFGTNQTERMRITSGGNVLMGKTVTGAVLTNGFEFNPTDNYLSICNSTSANYSLYVANTGTSGTRNMVAFYGTSSLVGSITYNGTVTAYNSTSDYRLKQDFKNYNGLDLISAIKTYDYEWKSDKSRMYGVMAHELQEILPYAVTGIKDGKEMQQVDYSKIVPILVRSIQELKLEIETLKNK